MYESDSGFIVQFSTRDKAEHLARGFDILSVEEFEEGALPRISSGSQSEKNE